jgi:hypothetical protein
MSQAGKFVIFQRGDGSKVAVQVANIIFLARGDHGTVLNFGGGTQVVVREEFDEVFALLEAQT